MKGANFFEIGAKLLGLYFLVWGIISLMSALLTLIELKHGDFMSEHLYLPLLVAPIMMICISLYLIRSRNVRHIGAFEVDVANDETRLPGLFELGIKLLGIYLVIDNLQSFASILANYLWVISDSLYGSRRMAAESLERSTNVLPRLMLILFGILLLRRGDLLVNWAFEVKANKTSDDS